MPLVKYSTDIFSLNFALPVFTTAPTIFNMLKVNFSIDVSLFFIAKNFELKIHLVSKLVALFF